MYLSTATLNSYSYYNFLFPVILSYHCNYFIHMINLESCLIHVYTLVHKYIAFKYTDVIRVTERCTNLSTVLKATENYIFFCKFT